MSCWWKMLQIIFLYLVLATQYSFYKATPLSGPDVNIAYLGENSFIVSLSRNRTSESEELNHFCGGALITTNHILTAAHCLVKKKYHHVVAKVGSIDLRNAEIYEVEMWVTYNEWADIEVSDNLPLLNYDIAVIKLRHSVNIDASIIPEIAFIPKENLYGNVIETGGWGLHEGNERSRYMRVAKFAILFPENCVGFRRKDPYLAERVKKLYLCASASGARTECGDSGNPVLFNNTIIGVTRGGCVKLSEPALYPESFISSLNYDPSFVTDMMKK